MTRKVKNFALLAIGAALLSRGEIANGAIVNFGAATEFVDSSDFNPLPHIIYAINGGNAGDSHTVNIGGTPVFFESILDTFNATATGGDTFSGTIGQLYGPELPVGHVPLATDQIALDEVLASQNYVDGDGASFSITLQNLSVGQSYRLQVIGPADSRGCCSARVHDVASADGGTAGTVHRFADLDADTNMHVTTIFGDFTADATEQEFIFGGGVNGGGEGALLLSSNMPFQIAEPQLTINRTTGQVVLENVNAFAGTDIRGYSLLSSGGAINHTAWLSVSDNYDLSSGGEVDGNDNWTEAAANATELSEFNFASPGTTGTPGDAAPLDPDQAINLGNAWFRTPIEDVVAELAFADGDVESVPVVYTGTAPLSGDLNSDNSINPTDWQLFKDGSTGPDLSTITAVAAYRRGDLDGDFDRDLFDFGLFKDAFDGANGAGALAGLISSGAVPEPASVSLVLLGLLGAAGWRFRRRANPIAAALIAVAAIALIGPREARAVSFDFGAPFELEDSNDINLSLGFVAYAVNAGAAGDSQTVNVGGTSVFFEAFPDTANMSIVTGDVATFSGAIGDLYTTATDQTALDEILNSQAYNDGTPFTLRLENLQVGRNYGLQVIGPPDTRGCCSARVHTVESADGGAPGDISRNQDLDSSGLGHVLSSFGTFTANATFQDLVFAGANNAGWGGLILTTDSPTKLQLTVNTTTGNIALENNTGSNVAIDSYQIVSPGGSLDPNGWNSISDRVTPISGFPQGNGSGNGWESDSKADGTELVEWNLQTSSGSSFAAGASINLGAAYDEAQNGEDLQLFYRAIESSGAANGDYNNNGTVDAADYTVWRDNLGSAANLPNDTTPGSVTQADYDVWKGNFGAGGGNVGAVVQGVVLYTGAASAQESSAVPEPSSCLILLTGVTVAWLINRSRVRGTGLSMTATAVRAGSFLGAALIASSAWGAFTLDRNYRLGEGDNDSGTPTAGAAVGSTTSTGDTFDNAGTSGSGTLHDLTPNGAPVYASVAARPLASGSTLGVAFDGVDDFLTGFRLGLPSTSAAAETSTQIATDGTTPVIGTLDYSGIANRGFQFWVNPNDAALSGGVQAVVLDGNQHGVLISDTGTWVMRYAGIDFDTGVTVKLDAIDGGWSHVMLARPFGSAGGAGGARMFVDGEGIGGAAGGYDGADANYLTLGASTGNLSDFDSGNDPGTSDFFTGVIDDLEMFVLGTSTADRIDYGVFNFATDNEFAAADLTGVDPADVNRDGNLNGVDVTALLANWRDSNTINGINVSGLSFRDQGDLNFDGVVDIRDAVILHNGLLAAGGAGLDLARLAGAVPEPTSGLMLSLGLTMAASRLRGRRRR